MKFADFFSSGPRPLSQTIPGASSSMIFNGKTFDFLDFGASKGGSIEFAKALFAVEDGLGIDRDPNKVAHMQSLGYECMQGDLLNLDLPNKSIPFVVMSHFLEHLPDLEAVRGVLQTAASVAQDFLFIMGPYFDQDEELAKQGFKFFWSDWKGHPCHLTTGQLARLLEELGLAHYQMMLAYPISDSSDKTLHPLNSPPDQAYYDPTIHPPKATTSLKDTVYKEILCVVSLREFQGWDKVVRRVTRKKKALHMTPDIETNESSARNGRTFLAIGDPIKKTAPKRMKYLNDVCFRLLYLRGWTYVRYLHMREAFLHTPTTKTILFLQGRYALEALALAIEFPDVRVLVSDSEGPTQKRFVISQNLADEWSIENFATVNHQPDDQATFDLVYAIDTLIFQSDDAAAAKEWLAKTDKYLVSFEPFCSARFTQTPQRLQNLHAKTGQYHYGYFAQSHAELFPKVLYQRGALWGSGGQQWQEHLNLVQADQLSEERERLFELAWRDILDRVPIRQNEALSIWSLISV